MRELQRREDDLRDTGRFLLVSQMTPRFALYYNVTDDVYVMNDPKGGTLFKRSSDARPPSRSGLSSESPLASFAARASESKAFASRS